MFEKYLNFIEKKTNNTLQSLQKKLNESIDAKSPVDIWTYIKWNKSEINKNKLDVFNDSEESVKVEYGWRKKAVNWHKKDWTIIYTGIWARVYTRTIDEKEEEISKQLKKIFDN